MSKEVVDINALKAIVDGIKPEKVEPKEVVAQYNCSFCGHTSEQKYLPETVAKYRDLLDDEVLNFTCPECGLTAEEADEFAINF